jgi:hypothetical protein
MPPRTRPLSHRSPWAWTVAAAGHPDTPVRGSDAEELVTLFGSHEERGRHPRSPARVGTRRHDRRRVRRAQRHRRAPARPRPPADAARERYDVPIHSHEFSALAAPRTVSRTPEERVQHALVLTGAGSSARSTRSARRFRTPSARTASH